MLHRRAEPPLTLDSPDAAQRFFASCFAELEPDREHLWVAHVDDRGLCIHLTRHEGDATGADFPLRAIVADAAIHASAGILLAHNHPSGDPTPSAADRLLTGRLALVTGALGCDLIDHWIFGRGECRSFKAMRLL